MDAVVRSDATTAVSSPWRITNCGKDSEPNSSARVSAASDMCCRSRLVRLHCRLGCVDSKPRRDGRDTTSEGDERTWAACAGSESDETDDDERPRRRRRVCSDMVPDANRMLGLTLEVEEQSAVADCGVQLWRGALLLTDWLLHCEHSSLELGAEPRIAACDKRNPRLAVGIELGCGVGLCSIVLSRLCRTVYATDLPGRVLPICARNVERNTASVLDDTLQGQSDAVRIRALNWNDADALFSRTRCRHGCTVSGHAAGYGATSRRFPLCGEWSMQETDADMLSQLSVVIAADVLYDAATTVAFVRLLPQLLITSSDSKAQNAPSQRQRWLWLSLERRIVFSVAQLRAHSPAVELFFDLVDADGRFTATQIPTADIPQRCIEYDRTPQLELWRIEPKALRKPA